MVVLLHQLCAWIPPQFPMVRWDCGTYFLPESPNISPHISRVGFWHLFCAQIPKHFITRLEGWNLELISCLNPPTFHHHPFARWDSGTYFVHESPIISPPFRRERFWHIFRAWIPQHFTFLSQGGILELNSCLNPPTFHHPFAGWDCGTYFVSESLNINTTL